jgi:hypothetical protein
MCSGCSGDYAGDFEEPCDSVSESSSNNASAYGDRPKGNGNRLSDEVAGGFEDRLHAHGSSSRTDLPVSRSENGAETCEVLVNATHIVEIRVFAINSERMREFLENESGDVCVP